MKFEHIHPDLLTEIKQKSRRAHIIHGSVIVYSSEYFAAYDCSPRHTMFRKGVYAGLLRIGIKTMRGVCYELTSEGEKFIASLMDL